jgi:hypothetical protein
MLAALGNVNPSHLSDRKLQAGAANERESLPDAPVVPLRLVNARDR